MRTKILKKKLKNRLIKKKKWKKQGKFACRKAGPTGIEPAAYGLRVRRSGLTELRARKWSGEKKFSSTNIDISLIIDHLNLFKIIFPLVCCLEKRRTNY